MKRNCVICGKPFEAHRHDSHTCGTSSCRSKLSRQRRKIRETERANLLSSDDIRMMQWLEQHAPQAEQALRTLYLLHGKAAFRMAATALRSAVIADRRQTAPAR